MIEFSLDGNKAQAVMSLYKGDKIKSWYNYHITKHVIGDFHKESFFQLIGLSENQRNDIKDLQRKKYYCGVESSSSDPTICYLCGYVDSCYNTLKDVRENYKRIIRDSVVNDTFIPRHAHTLKGRKTKEELIVLNNSSVTIIMKEKSDRYHVTTCYRLANIKKHKNLEGYSIMNDDEICLEASKAMWRRRFRGTRFSSVTEHQPVNWNPIEQ